MTWSSFNEATEAHNSTCDFPFLDTEPTIYFGSSNSQESLLNSDRSRNWSSEVVDSPEVLPSLIPSNMDDDNYDIPPPGLDDERPPHVPTKGPPRLPTKDFGVSRRHMSKAPSPEKSISCTSNSSRSSLDVKRLHTFAKSLRNAVSPWTAVEHVNVSGYIEIPTPKKRNTERKESDISLPDDPATIGWQSARMGSKLRKFS
ncbi:unnamed protein product [Somion occarium]|uniref:Uncharacterized protein n=1 Tax=Somion occarium TaxID=3059160 RepID=A0ABP1EER8_9APHY